MGDRLMTVNEVAEYLRKSPGAFRYQIHVGNAPRSAKLGGRRMFKESEVLAWVEQQFAADDEKATA